MTTLKQIIFASAFIFALMSIAIAQESPSTTAQRSSLTITASATGERVRITAPSSVVQMHVEVYAASGEKLFDQEIRGGNVFDWHLQDGQAQRLAPGDYVCVVTAKSISGKIAQKIGTVIVEEKSVTVQAAESLKLSAPQAQTIGPVEENSSWTIAAKDQPQTPTVIANDGTDGQMIRGRGALSFRIGDFFSGNDKEQMRLTEEGNLGIGTSEPKAKLDVAGTIRAERFLVVKPKLAGVDKTDTLAADAVDSVQPLASGTGTQDRIAKWTDNAGTLGDSGITETAGGNVGIGTTVPGSKLVVSSNSATLPAATGIARFADANGVQTAVFADAFGTNPIFNVRRANGTAASPSALQADQIVGVIGASGYGASTYSGTRARVAFLASENWTNSANGTYLTFNTTANGAATPGGTERMRIDNAGNVGIGTAAPTSNLIVAQGTVGPGVVATVAGLPEVFGTNTQFLNTFQVGDTITVSGLPAGTVITGITSDFLLIVSAFPTATASNLTYTLAGGTRMAVKGNGNVGIGTATPFQRLQVIGDIRVGTASGNGCLMGFNGTVITGSCSSDRRMKRDITPFPRLLDKLVKLQPVNFYWRSAEFPERHFGPAQSYGLIAQEVEQVLPELVAKDEKGYKMMDYSKLPLLLLQAVKDLKVENETLQQRNAALDARLWLIERTLKNKRGSTRQLR